MAWWLNGCSTISLTTALAGCWQRNQIAFAASSATIIFFTLHLQLDMIPKEVSVPPRKILVILCPFFSALPLHFAACPPARICWQHMRRHQPSRVLPSTPGIWMISPFWLFIVGKKLSTTEKEQKIMMDRFLKLIFESVPYSDDSDSAALMSISGEANCEKHFLWDLQHLPAA